MAVRAHSEIWGDPAATCLFPIGSTRYWAFAVTRETGPCYPSTPGQAPVEVPDPWVFRLRRAGPREARLGAPSEPDLSWQLSVLWRPLLTPPSEAHLGLSP